MRELFFKAITLFILLILTTQVWAQVIQLSAEAKISVVVADPGTHELFEAFGHPAIRVYDPANKVDLAFNYGIFDFDQPYFYLNFTRGYLNYMVAAWPYRTFENAYISEDRSLKEYVLNLSGQQKQEIFDFLANNVKPENRNYFYDYFYDNCSTRIWDVFEKVLGDDLHFDKTYTATGHSFRTLVDSLTVHKPWGDFGIDLCLGLPMDKKLSAYEYMYLPEFLGRSLAHADITIEGEEMSFVQETKMIYESAPNELDPGTFTPTFLFWSIFIVVLLLTVVGFLKREKMSWIDFTLFSVTGLIGLLLLVLWAITDHQAAANNLNIIWANPLYLFGIIVFARNKKAALAYGFFIFVSAVLMLFLVTFPVNPQGINVAVIPIALALLIRSVYLSFNIKRMRHNS